MAHDDPFFTPHRVDEQIDLLSGSSAHAPASADPSPEARLVEDLRDLHAEASLEHSLQRAWERLERRRAASPQPRGVAEPLIRSTLQEERPSLMQIKRPTLLVPDGRKLIARLGVIAAALVLVALVGGLTAGLILIRQPRTVATDNPTATVQPTAMAPSVPPQTNLYLNSMLDATISKVDPITQKTVWTYNWGQQIKGASSFSPLMVGDGTVYYSVGISSGQNAVQIYLFALDAQHGTLRWQVQQPAQATPVLIEPGVVYVSAADGLYALNASDGTVRWHAAVNADESMVLANGTLYGTIFHDSSTQQWSSTLFAVNASNGAVLWQIALPLNKAFTVTAAANSTLYLFSVQQKYPTSSALIALDDGKPKVSYAYAYSLDGKQLWQSQAFDGYISYPASADGLVYFATANTMYALDAATGATRWHYQVSTGSTWGIEGKPIIDNGTVYLETGPFSSGTSVPTSLISLDAQHGTLHWKAQVLSPTSVVVSDCALANGALFLIGGYPPSLQAFSATDGKPLWQMPLGKNFFDLWLIAAP